MRNKRVKLLALLAVPVLLFTVVVPVAQHRRQRLEVQAATQALFSELGREKPQLPTVQNLLAAGANARGRDGKGYTPLELTARDPNIGGDILKLLLDRGANPNDNFLGNLPVLKVAAQSGSPDKVRFLLNKGADVNARDTSGNTALSTTRFALKSAKSSDEIAEYREIERMLKAAGAKG